jgi:hypothetical protein
MTGVAVSELVRKALVEFLGKDSIAAQRHPQATLEQALAALDKAPSPVPH